MKYFLRQIKLYKNVNVICNTKLNNFVRDMLQHNKNTNYDRTHLFLLVIVVILDIGHYITSNKYTKSGTKRICEGIPVQGHHMMILIS